MPPRPARPRPAAGDPLADARWAFLGLVVAGAGRRYEKLSHPAQAKRAAKLRRRLRLLSEGQP